MPVIKPDWLIEAEKNIGVTEIKGGKHNGRIVGWLQKLRAWWAEDETPWCGTFVAHCMTVAKHPIPKAWYRAKAWLEWGDPVSVPVIGAVVIFDRQGGGHVGFVVGKDSRGNLMVLGGNQGDMVKVSPFAISRVAGLRLPRGYAVPVGNYILPVLASDGKVSTNEA